MEERKDKGQMSEEFKKLEKILYEISSKITFWLGFIFFLLLFKP